MQIALLFSTDPSIDANGFVPLIDDKHLQDAENLTPVIRTEKLNDEIRGALDAVSAALTTEQRDRARRARSWCAVRMWRVWPETSWSRTACSNAGSTLCLRAQERYAFHGPTPPRRSGVILVTNPGGGSGMPGNTTSGPMYVCASR